MPALGIRLHETAIVAGASNQMAERHRFEVAFQVLKAQGQRIVDLAVDRQVQAARASGVASGTVPLLRTNMRSPGATSSSRRGGGASRLSGRSLITESPGF